ncbi:MAG: nicotinate phosphoribosyltransferase [bacterium]|nr:nicotinate phosphoribosyltransferase [bacterium]
MSIFDQQRLTNAVFKLDVDGLRRGFYSDRYFTNIVRILEGLNREGYTFAGLSPRALPVDPTGTALGDTIVEAQIFNRRAPYALIAGTDIALSMLRHATGYFEGEQFIETWNDLEVVSVEDGVMTHYEGNPQTVSTVIEIRGRYRDFTLLETTMLGVLSRASRIATNVYNILQVSKGKGVLFFPARFDLPQTQAIDGYAYRLAVQRHNQETGRSMRPLVSTDAGASWWGGRGGGTIPHAIIATFLADTAEAMLAFARHIPVETPRIVLVDFNNDSVGAARATLDAYWPHYLAALQAGDETEQRRWTLDGIRMDTSANMLDVSLAEGDERGVSPRLVRVVREALDHAWEGWNVPPQWQEAAKDYCRQIQIVVSGGFNRDKIERFEREGVPVDSYGVGSTFLTNDKATNTDFTMDVVRIKVRGQWVDVPKVGRLPGDNPDLRPVDLAGL